MDRLSDDSNKIKDVMKLKSGVSMKVLRRQNFNWDDIRSLAEAGVSYAEIADKYNGLTRQLIQKKAHADKWMTPHREAKMRKEIERKQSEELARTGNVKDLEDVRAEIWEERGARVNEIAYDIAEKALVAAQKSEVAVDMISDAKDLDTVVKVARTVTGQTRREEENAAPQVAVNIGLLRSAGGSVIDV